MGAIKDSINKQIDKYNKTQFGNTTGTILKYDKTTNVCIVKYPNPNGQGDITRKNVPITDNTGGIVTGADHTGKKCSISFIANNAYAPVIGGIYDNNYQNRLCSDQGSFIAGDEVYKVGTPEHIIAMNTDWIDDKNKNIDKYQNDITNYSDIDADQEAIELVSSINRYNENDVGINNIYNKSTIKLKDNGDIDIFTENNTGIRICKSGNIKLYGLDIEFTKSDGDSDKTDKSISTQLKVAQMMKICLAYDIIKETDTYVETINESTSDITALNSDKT